MDIKYVDYNSKEEEINVNIFCNDTYNMIKKDRNMCGFFLYLEKLIGVCVLLKKEDYIQIVVFNIDDNILEILVKRYIEHIFMFIKNNKYNKIKVLNTKGIKSLERYIYGAEYINYNLYNCKMENIKKEEIINIEKKNEEGKKKYKYDTYQLLYFKNTKNCNLYCC